MQWLYFYIIVKIFSNIYLYKNIKIIKELYMSFSLAHNSKKINYRELFSVAQCAKLNYFFALYQNTNYIIKKE